MNTFYFQLDCSEKILKMNTKVFLIILLSVFSFAVSSAQPKKIQITGRVTDSAQNPVAGATIFVDNQQTGKVTGKNGTYKIKIPADSKKISVLAASGEIAESPVNEQKEINFSLPVSFSSLKKNISKPADDSQEEEINMGYGTVKKSSVTSQVTKIDNTNQKFMYRDIYEMLRGKPGVQVSGKSIKIQGASSFIAGTEPLLVVDGSVVSSIDDIIPTNVKSIEILKGSSASIYGSRGANGVILITLIGAR